jgi:hypothetical protein
MPAVSALEPLAGVFELIEYRARAVFDDWFTVCGGGEEVMLTSAHGECGGVLKDDISKLSG